MLEDCLFAQAVLCHCLGNLDKLSRALCRYCRAFYGRLSFSSCLHSGARYFKRRHNMLARNFSKHVGPRGDLAFCGELTACFTGSS